MSISCKISAFSSTMSLCSYFLVFLVVALGNAVSCSENSNKIVYAPIITVPKQGALRGKILSSRKGKQIFAYLGIPYAKAPVGKLRFETPRILSESWDDIRDATKERSRCPQLSYPERKYEGNEDCLYLNVYTTRLPINDTEVGTVVWDVVVLIHGGGFTFGSGDADEYSPEHLLDEDMVLVTFNYRLGALGFLATGDEFAPGNYGLKDQVDVLRWVHRNIPHFSGNPNSVTVFGVHAGGASAHYHMLSPLSNKLIHGVISQSGTALSPWAHVSVKDAHHRAFKLGELLGCSKDELNTTKSLVKCLRSKRSEDIVKESTHVVEWSHDLSFPFVPVVEPEIDNVKRFLPEHPKMMIRYLKGNKGLIPWIIGVATHEGLPQALTMMVFPKMMEQLNHEPGKYLPLYLGMTSEAESKVEDIAREIWQYYLQNETLSYGNLVQLAAITSDYNYFHGVSKSVALHSSVSESPIFVYQFSYNSRDSRFVLGVPQGDDTRYLFPDTIGGEKLEFEEEAYEIVDRLVKLVANFARDGDPTPEESEMFNNVLWPPAEGTDFQFVDMGKKMEIVTDGFYPERMSFWNKIESKMRSDKPVKDEL